MDRVKLDKKLLFDLKKKNRLKSKQNRINKTPRFEVDSNSVKNNFPESVPVYQTSGDTLVSLIKYKGQIYASNFQKIAK